MGSFYYYLATMQARHHSSTPQGPLHLPWSKGSVLVLVGTVLLLLGVGYLAGLFFDPFHAKAGGSEPQAEKEKAKEEKKKTSDKQNAKPPPKRVQVVHPARKDMARTLTVPANISPLYQTTLYARVPGYLKWIGVDKGDPISEGQLLAIIEAPEIVDQYRRAESDYRIKRLTYKRLLGVWQENPDVIAKQDVDVARAAAEEAQHIRDTQKALLDYTKVYAPFSGYVTARFVDPGAMVQMATKTATQATPLLTLMDVNTLRIYLNVPQELALFTKPGVPVSVEAAELAGRTLHGKVVRTTRALQASTRTILAEVDLPNPEHQLWPGMFVRATLGLELHKDAIVVPPDTLEANQKQQGSDQEKDEGQKKQLGHSPGQARDQHSVFVAVDNKAHRVPVELGLDDGQWVEITEGLKGDEAIIIGDKEHLREGTPVEASPANLPEGKPAYQKM